MASQQPEWNLACARARMEQRTYFDCTWSSCFAQQTSGSASREGLTRSRIVVAVSPGGMLLLLVNGSGGRFGHGQDRADDYPAPSAAGVNMRQLGANGSGGRKGEHQSVSQTMS